MNSLRDKLFRDGLYTFVFRVAGMGLAAVVGIITARALGPSGRGIYALPMVDAALVSAAYAGLSTATSYFMLRERAGRGVILPALGVAGLFVLVGIPAAVILAYLEGAPWAAVPAILTLPASAVLNLLYGYQVGVDRVRGNSSVALLNTAVLLIFVIAALVTHGPQAHAVIAAWVIASDVFAAGALLWILRDARRLDTNPVHFWSYAAYCARVGGVALVSLLNYRADVYIVAALAGSALLGMYTLAVAAAEMLLLTTQVTASVSSPHIGGMESTQAAAELTARCVRNNVLIAFIACALLWVLAPIAVRILYGAAFLPMIPAFRVLLVGVFALSIGSPMATYFTIRLGKPQLPLVFAGLSAIVCIGVSLATVRQYNMLGAALGSTLGYIVGQTSGTLAFARMTNVPISRILLPRWSDAVAYVEATGALIRRLRPAAPSAS